MSNGNEQREMGSVKRSRWLGGSPGTLVALFAVLVGGSLAGLTGPARAAPGEIGVLGCSNTAIAAIGYHQVSEVGRLWHASVDDNPFADYWGNDIVKWADVDGQGRSPWAAFEAELVANPATTAVWLQLCVRAETPGSTDTVDTIVTEIRQRLPQATIYASPLDDTPGCTIGDPARSLEYVDHLVGTGQALRGPTMSPLPSDQVKGCHASGAGIDLHGADLAAFFDDGAMPPPDGQSPGFADVGADHVFAEDIAWLADQGITRGCNPPANDRFCPDERVSRAQMAAFLVRALLLPPSDFDAFADDTGSVFESDIDAFAAAGITSGCGPAAFCPDDPVTRAQMATFLVNAFGLAGGDGADLFIDDAGVHEPDIDILGTSGVTQGCNPPVNDRYCPDEPVTRGQMAAFLRRVEG
ncbi:MAG: S-layer homology domain-containing protein [Acidimicrobiia bacterium]